MRCAQCNWTWQQLNCEQEFLAQNLCQCHSQLIYLKVSILDFALRSSNYFNINLLIEIPVWLWHRQTAAAIMEKCDCVAHEWHSGLFLTDYPVTAATYCATHAPNEIYFTFNVINQSRVNPSNCSQGNPLHRRQNIAIQIFTWKKNRHICIR